MNRRHRHPLALTALLAALAPVVVGAPSASAAPSCDEGPRIVGNAYVGTPCDDTIRAPRGVTVVYGEGGDDILYGQRGNDTLYGGEGDDRLYGGIGDDRLRGGPGNDLLSGGFGADNLDGEAGDDLARGDATIDAIADSGGAADTDTLSYATGVTPGFFDRQGPPHFYPDFSAYESFPQAVDGRGVYVNQETGKGDNGVAPAGGGVDEAIDAASFEIVIGTAFADFIVGTGDDQTFYGGGGADVILGHGGNDRVFGGAEGDYCEAAAGTTLSECELSGGEQRVEPRDPADVSAGVIAPREGSAPALYLTGGDGDDTILASYSASPPQVSFSANGSPAGVFPLSAPPDSLLLAGLEGDDSLTAANFPATTSVVLLGGEGNDELTGGATEDALVDGSGNDEVEAGGGDDAVPNNAGADQLHAGPGEDLFISDAVCEGDLLDGGGDRDNANWANFDQAVAIDMGARSAGLVGFAGQPDCGDGSLSSLVGVEDVEGTSFDDTLIGDSGPNQMLGRPGHDSYFAAAGDDSILANSGDTDLAIDCGPGWDTALVDIPTHTPEDNYEDPAPSGCEDVEERAPSSFRPPGTPPDPSPEPEAPAAEASRSAPPAPPRIGDRTAPRTRILHRPRGRVFTARRFRRVAFAFRANERRARFRCKLDRRPFRPCGSPRRYRLRPGRHAFRVFAIDAAGNRDRSAAVFRFAVHRVSARSSRSHRRRGPTR